MLSMTEDLERAARAFRRAEAALDRARINLADAIVDASGEGVRQSEIARITGYTRETVRRILRSVDQPVDTTF